MTKWLSTRLRLGQSLDEKQANTKDFVFLLGNSSRLSFFLASREGGSIGRFRPDFFFPVVRPHEEKGNGFSKEQKGRGQHIPIKEREQNRTWFTTPTKHNRADLRDRGRAAYSLFNVGSVDEGEIDGLRHIGSGQDQHVVPLSKIVDLDIVPHCRQCHT